MVANPNVATATDWMLMADADLKGANRAEHLLIRCFMKGLMGGGITVTNTPMRQTPFNRSIRFPGLSQVHVYFGNKFAWPAGNARTANVVNNAF